MSGAENVWVVLSTYQCRTRRHEIPDATVVSCFHTLETPAHICVRECVRESVRESVSVWVSGCVREYVHGYVRVCVVRDGVYGHVWMWFRPGVSAWVC